MHGILDLNTATIAGDPAAQDSPLIALITGITGGWFDSRYDFSVEMGWPFDLVDPDHPTEIICYSEASANLDQWARLKAMPRQRALGEYRRLKLAASKATGDGYRLLNVARFFPGHPSGLFRYWELDDNFSDDLTRSYITVGRQVIVQEPNIGCRYLNEDEVIKLWLKLRQLRFAQQSTALTG